MIDETARSLQPRNEVILQQMDTSALLPPSAPRFSQRRLAAICATCGISVTPPPGVPAGHAYWCKRQMPDQPPHLARVVKLPAGRFWLLYIEWPLLQFEIFWPPIDWLRRRHGFYLLGRFLLLGALLRFNPPATTALAAWPTVLACLFIAESLASTTSVAFISRWPASVLRSFVLTLWTYLQAAMAYAVVYGNAFWNGFNHALRPVQALYFSMTTMTTVGYGDITPRADALGLQLTVITQMMASLYFVAAILSIVVGWSSSPPRPSRSLDELATEFSVHVHESAEV